MKSNVSMEKKEKKIFQQIHIHFSPRLSPFQWHTRKLIILDFCPISITFLAFQVFCFLLSNKSISILWETTSFSPGECSIYILNAIIDNSKANNKIPSLSWIGSGGLNTNRNKMNIIDFFSLSGWKLDLATSHGYAIFFDKCNVFIISSFSVSIVDKNNHSIDFATATLIIFTKYIFHVLQAPNERCCINAISQSTRPKYCHNLSRWNDYI